VEGLTDSDSSIFRGAVHCLGILFMASDFIKRERSALSMRPNPALDQSAQQLRRWVPAARCAAAPAQLCR
jgi:hypothetical protein